MSIAIPHCDLALHLPDALLHQTQMCYKLYSIINSAKIMHFSLMLNHPPFHKAIFIMFANFYCSDNFVRLCIVQVFRESQKHLDKINNIEEFQIRIFQVIHSNDPVARAITIRYFISLYCLNSFLFS